MKFKLSDSFINSYKRKKVPFGFNGLGELVYLRTYSRLKDNSENEKWFETVERVVNGTYNIQKDYILSSKLPWDDLKAQDSAQEMYDHMFYMRFLPPGRGLWAMGSSITEDKKTYAALNNCGFVSTEFIKDDFAEPFAFLMDLSMLGVGVGFDTKGAGKIVVRGPNKKIKGSGVFEIPDTREGWVESVRLLIESYLLGSAEIEFTYDQIREPGLLIKGFGGYSSGYKPLEETHHGIREVLEQNRGKLLTARSIVDIQNLIGKCVISGNVRRTAEIAFGDFNSDEYLHLKDYRVNPEREAFGWTSNNSVFADIGADYEKISTLIRLNGEPGVAWLENMRAYGRMKDAVNNRDYRAMGANPCVEQTLENYELCNLVEVFPAKHKSIEDFKRTLKFSYLYAKTVTLCPTHWPRTNTVMFRNRRIGNSVSGLAQFVATHGVNDLIEWLNIGYDTIQGYDKIYSDWMCIPRSIKTTSIKPSGSVSLLAGATPGMHWPESEYYIRRVRIAKESALVPPLKAAGYNVEPCSDDVKNTVVVDFPVHVGEGVRSVKDVSMWEQFSMAALLQREWADNQVSCTVTFDPPSEGWQIADALNYFQYQLKAISLLPRVREGAYEQMPYEAIDYERYDSLVSKLKPVNFSQVQVQAESEKFCDNDSCELTIGN